MSTKYLAVQIDFHSSVYTAPIRIKKSRTKRSLSEHKFVMVEDLAIGVRLWLDIRRTDDAVHRDDIIAGHAAVAHSHHLPAQALQPQRF